MGKVFAALAAIALVPAGLLTPVASFAAASTVCTGVSGCKIVKSIDVDGDARADEIGIIAKGLTGERGTITVRVKRATGGILQTTGGGVHWLENPFIGAAPVDGVKGAEILVGDQEGAHFQQFRMITYRAGHLVTENRPPQAPISGLSSRWGIDSSLSSNIGLYRSVAGGVVTLTVKTAVLNNSGSAYTGKTIVYTWRGGWVVKSNRTVHYANAGATAYLGGLWIEGLPPYGGYPYPMTFSSCAKLNEFYPHGVGKHGARDKTSGTPVTSFYRDNGLYAANDGPRAGSQYDLDRDNDGIACEKR
jgi:hypothetical protein